MRTLMPLVLVNVTHDETFDWAIALNGYWLVSRAAVEVPV